MNRRLASLIVLVMMLVGGAYSAPPARASYGVEVGISLGPKPLSSKRAEVQIEQRVKAEFLRRRQTVLVGESPPVVSQAGKALYQRPPPTA